MRVTHDFCPVRLHRGNHIPYKRRRFLLFRRSDPPAVCRLSRWSLAAYVGIVALDMLEAGYEAELRKGIRASSNFVRGQSHLDIMRDVGLAV